MAFSKLQKRFNLLCLNEHEEYLFDHPNFMVRIIQAINKTKIQLPTCQTQDIMSDHHNLVDSIQSFLNLSRDVPNQIFLRLCSKSLIFEYQNQITDLTKLLFDKILNVWFWDSNMPDQSILPMSVPMAFPRLVILASSVIQIKGCLIEGYHRVVKPYKYETGPFIVELTSTDIVEVPCPQPQWFNNDLSHLIKCQHLIKNADPLFFLIFIKEFIATMSTRHTNNQQKKQHSNTLVTIVQDIIHIKPSLDEFPYGLLDHREIILQPALRVHRQLPLQRCRGLISITDGGLYFRSYPSLGGNELYRVPIASMTFGTIRIVDLKLSSINLFHKKVGHGTKIFELNLIFETTKIMEDVVDILSKIKPNLFKFELSRELLSTVTELWAHWKIDNFHYLFFLNSIANRSTEDLSQYPVMPWTYINLTTDSINLNDEHNYRDLTVAVGSLNLKNLELLKQRMKEMSLHTLLNDDGNSHSLAEGHPATSNTDENASQSKDEQQKVELLLNQNQPFLFGSHYSVAAYIVYWLIRLAPECQLRLQSGRFDSWPRLFHSVSRTWDSLFNGRSTTFMELIPEFYDHNNPEFLENRLGLDMSESLNGNQHKK